MTSESGTPYTTVREIPFEILAHVESDWREHMKRLLAHVRQSVERAPAEGRRDWSWHLTSLRAVSASMGHDMTLKDAAMLREVADFLAARPSPVSEPTDTTELENALKALDRIVGKMVMQGHPSSNEAFECLKVLQRAARRPSEAP